MFDLYFKISLVRNKVKAKKEKSLAYLLLGFYIIYGFLSAFC